MKYIAVILLFSPSLISAKVNKKVIGNSEFCAIGAKEIWCTAHDFNFCLHVLNQTSGAIECVENKGQFK